VTLPEAASLATPAGSGPIGAARDTPETPTKTRAAIAIANTIRIMLFLLGANSSLPEVQYRKNVAVPRHWN
jgi:hypothetical protein